MEHVIEAGRAPLQPLCRAQRAGSIGHAALRAHGQFDALAGAGEDHGVLADDVAAADRVEADLGGGSFPGIAFSAVGRHALQIPARSEEHTSELQSRLHLVCRLLLEKKKKYKSCSLHLRKKNPTSPPRTRTP